MKRDRERDRDRDRGHDRSIDRIRGKDDRIGRDSGYGIAHYSGSRDDDHWLSRDGRDMRDNRYIIILKYKFVQHNLFNLEMLMYLILN